MSHSSRAYQKALFAPDALTPAEREFTRGVRPIWDSFIPDRFDEGFDLDGTADLDKPEIDPVTVHPSFAEQPPFCEDMP